MAEANITQGYMIHEGLYRVPDLLTEDQFKLYMKETYGVEVSFNHLNPAGDHGSDLGPTGQEVVTNSEDTTPTPPASETTSPVSETETTSE